MSRLSFSLFVVLFLQCFFSSTARAATSPNWPGWNEIRNLFVFGDSYTATGFNISDTQPSTETPMGNPPAPGITFSNGRNWLNYLTSTYNASSLLTYNFAAGGATIDPDIFISRIPSFRNQVSDIFLPTYGNASTASWDSSNSLFITFFGINDVGITYRTPNASLTSRIIDSYTAGLEELYLSGARNFLVVNVPAVHRAPATTGLNHSADFVEAERKGITDFNRRVRGMGEGVVKTHNDATVFVFDAFTVFSEILDDPGSYEGSGGIVDTVGFCGGYSRRTFNESAFDPDCGIPQRQYFWLDALHPTPPVHDVLAKEVAEQLERNQGVGMRGSGPELFTGGAAGWVGPSGWVAGGRVSGGYSIGLVSWVIMGFFLSTWVGFV